MKLALDRRDEIVAFVTSRIDYPLSYENVIHEAVGGEDEDGTLKLGVVFHLFKPLYGGFDLEFNGASDAGPYVPRAIIRDTFRFAYVSLNAIRLSATIGKKHKASRRFVEALGFHLEGRSKWGLGPGLDSITYGMIYKDCRWLSDEEKHAVSQRVEATQRASTNGGARGRS